MYAVEFISQTRKKHCKLDNHRIKYFAKTSCHQVSDSKIAYSNLQGIFNIRLMSLWDFSVFIGNIRLINYMSSVHVYVVVQFHPWFIFYLPLFWGMVMHDKKFETKENKI